MLTWYATSPKKQLDLAKAQSMTNSSAAQVGGTVNILSEIRKMDQVREMLTCLREFLSACLRYPANFGAKQNYTTVTLLFHSHISTVSRMIYKL